MNALFGVSCAIYVVNACFFEKMVSFHGRGNARRQGMPSQIHTYVATVVGVVMRFFVAVSGPLHTIMEYIADEKRCLVEGKQLVNAGHIIECSVVASKTTSMNIHLRSYVLQSALSKDPHTGDLKLANGATIHELSGTCPAGSLLFATPTAGNVLRGEVDCRHM